MNTMTCNYNEYMLHEINQTLALLPEQEQELRTILCRQRDEILRDIQNKEDDLHDFIR